MRNKKKIISVLLAVVLVFSLSAFVASAEPAVVDTEQMIVPFVWCCPFPNTTTIQLPVFGPIPGGGWGQIGWLITTQCMTCGAIGGS